MKKYIEELIRAHFSMSKQSITEELALLTELRDFITIMIDRRKEVIRRLPENKQ